MIRLGDTMRNWTIARGSAARYTTKRIPVTRSTQRNPKADFKLQQSLLNKTLVHKVSAIQLTITRYALLVTVKAKTEEVQAKDHYRRPGGGLRERYALTEMTTGSVRSWGGWVVVTGYNRRTAMYLRYRSA